jgi:hypothetical protein
MGVLHASNRFPHGILGGPRQDEGARPMETFTSRVGAPDGNEKEGQGEDLMSLLAFVPTKKTGNRHYENFKYLIIASGHGPMFFSALEQCLGLSLASW